MNPKPLAAADRALPSTTALRVFLAVAAEGTASRAASRLHLTQSAVSKQLLGLEASIGAALFERTAGGLKMTEAGQILLPYAKAAIEQMTKGILRARERDRPEQALRLHMVPIAGERWLMDRFPAFAAANPGIDVQFTNYVSETSAEEPDIAIRNGIGDWSDGDTTYLFGRRVALVVAPSLLDRTGPIGNSGDIQRLTYLQHFQMPAYWAEMTEAHGLRGALPARTVRYGYFSVIIKAAAAGLGIALTPICLVRDELASGALLNLLGLTFDSRSAFWLTVMRPRPAPDGLDRFVAWLAAEGAAFDRDDGVCANR
jgi:LysR family transcriptional regulator, glycine cleavage system transcriptional activator